MSITNRTFRLNHATGGSVAGSTHRTMVMIPEGSNIDLVGPVAGNPNLVGVLWNGQSVWIFASDFEARASEVPLTRAASVGGETPPTIVPTERNSVPTEVLRPEEQADRVTPKIRRFNAAGRELF